MAAAVGLGRAATMASVRAAGDDVARPLSRQHDLTGRQWKRWTCMQMKSFDRELGPAHVHSWNELTESSLEPCGTPAGSKGSPRPGGRTVAGARGAFKKIPGGGKGLSSSCEMCVVSDTTQSFERGRPRPGGDNGLGRAAVLDVYGVRCATGCDGCVLRVVVTRGVSER